MSIYAPYYPLVKKNKRKFEKALAKIGATKNLEDKLPLACAAATFATYNHTGYYASSILEKVFTDYGQSLILDDCDIAYTENSFLHVLTEGYATGGHTRVVERWIEQAPDGQKHSVIIANQGKDCLAVLHKNVAAHGGDFIQQPSKDTLADKALSLRKIALGYEYVVLHTHMHDPLALVAFGTAQFTRPIILFNHAYHLFWLGFSIADIVAEVHGDDYITQHHRHVACAVNLGIAIELQTRFSKDKAAARQELGITPNKKIVLTTGSNFKYTPVGKHHFTDILQMLMQQDQRIICYAIGPSEKDEHWHKAQIAAHGRIKLLGLVDYHNGYFDYIAAADLVLDSWPFPGGLASSDAITAGVPVLSLKSPIEQYDFLKKSQGFCENDDEFFLKACQALNQDDYAKTLAKEEKELLAADHSLESWRKKLQELIEMTPKQHIVRDLSFLKEEAVIDDAAVLLNLIYNKSFLNKSYVRELVNRTKYFHYKFIAQNKTKAAKYYFKIR